MPFCSNCGRELLDGAKFCDNCGFAVVPQPDRTKRTTTYEGSIHKCPNCGEILNAFVSNCPVCGYELRDASASDAIEAFSKRIQRARTVQEKANIINSFPIPNTKEDVWEFLILAHSNIEFESDDAVVRAWRIKSEQAFQKSQLLLTDDADRDRVQDMYDEITEILEKKEREDRREETKHNLTGLVPTLPHALVVVAWVVSLLVLLPLCRKNLDSVGTNGTQIVYMADLLLGAVVVPRMFACKYVLPKLIAAIGLVMNTTFLVPLCMRDLDSVGTNAFQIILVVDIIFALVIFVQMFQIKSQAQEGEQKLYGACILISLVCAVLFAAVYFVGTLLLPEQLTRSSDSPKISSENVDPTNKTADTDGIYTYPIRNYVGKNAASVGRISDGHYVDDYGNGRLNIIFVSADGMLLAPANDEARKEYKVIGQNLPANSNITVVHLRDSHGEPYSNLVDYQSYNEIVLYVTTVDGESYEPSYVQIEPTLDRHVYHIRDYVGRNAASFGDYSGSNRIDRYGVGEMRIDFATEDGTYIDKSDENILKCYIVTGQDIAANTELKLEYETNSRGEEYDNLLRSQNYEEITLTVKKIDESLTSQLPELNGQTTETAEESEYTDLTIEYKVLLGGKAKITGYSGDGNHVTIDSKVDGHEVVSIGDSAFKDCDTLESILFWADIEEIGDYAFSGCTALETISIPFETRTIGDHAFERCTNLTSATLWGDPDIGDYAFAGCTSLPKINIGYDTKEVGEHAFDGCTSLSSVTVWNDDTIIGKDAFANCPELTDRPVQK